MIKLKSSPVFFIIVLFTVLISSESFSQTKVGYIDSKKILESMQDSRDAKMRLDNLVTQWQSDLKVLQDSLKLIKEDFENAFKKVDLILTPTSPTTAFKIGEKSSDPLEMYLSDIYTTSANLAGIPGLNIPVGFDNNGLPIGMQLMANQFEEDLLLSFANTI